MKTMFWIPTDVRTAVLDVLVKIAVQHGLHDPKKGGASMSQALVALTGQHAEVKLLALPNSLAGVCARDKNDVVTLYLPHTAVNDAAMLALCAKHGGRGEMLGNGWVLYSNLAMSEAMYWDAYHDALSS